METGPDFYLESLCLAIYCNDLETEKILKNVIKIYEEDMKSGNSINDPISKFYISLINDIFNNKIDLNNSSELESFILRFEQNKLFKDNTIIPSRIETIVRNRHAVSDDKINALKNKIKKTIVWINGNIHLKKLFRTSQRIISTTDTVMQGALMNEMLDRARELTKTYEDSTTEEDSTIDFIDMTCPDSLKKGLESYKRKRVDSGFTTGLQGLNDMFGKSKGPVPGEFIGFAAMSHHYKSGILMDFARWVAIYNKPRDYNNKPSAIVFISLENEIYENMMMWFRAAYKNHYGYLKEGMSDNEMIEETAKLYKARGFKLFVYRKEGDLFGFEDWRALHEELSEKYTVICSIIDYIGLMKLHDGKDNPAKLRQELMCKMKNYSNRNSILTVTGFQLDAEAERISASGVTNVVKKFGPAHLADCKSAIKELDFLAFMYIEKNNMGIPYLTIKWAKHKYQITSDKYKYIAYKFEEGIGIPDDINGPSKVVYDIYADTATIDSSNNTGVSF